MHSNIRVFAILSLVTATTAAAQGPVPPRAGPARGGAVPAARMLLSHTGELALTDAQVVRLAAIARRQEARRVALRAQLDSNRLRMETQPADTAARRQLRERMRTTFERERTQSETDQRDAIAVLTPDQQGKAWQMVARGARAGRGGAMRGGAMRGMRRGPSMRGDAPGMRGQRGMRRMEPPAVREPRGQRPMREQPAARPLRRRPFDG